MSHLLYWPTVTYFYPVGNTSAVCLTENLPPETKADILLLGSGDPRHILYTVDVDNANPLACSRMLDITCCDMDAAILARNTLLFTLLADDGALENLGHIWDLFYHMLVDQATLTMFYEQCRKLVALAEDVETWRTGPYGQFITMCDAATLGELRRVWTGYLDTANFSSRQAKRYEGDFLDGMKEMARKSGPGYTTTAARSAGPLVLHAAHAVSRQYTNYWSSGTTDNLTPDQGSEKRRLAVNPTFVLSIDGDRFSVHYGTDPLCGFHLAEAFVSGKFSHLHDRERIPPHELVRVAKNQFTRWCVSMINRLKGTNPSSRTFVIRMFAGDALMICQALKYCEVTQSPATPYNVAAWRLSTIALDSHYYGRSTLCPAPLSFNVIDTSNLLDHIGLVNVLVATAPLLRKNPSATLYTEALRRTGDDPSRAILGHLCGDLPTMALLLGIIPVASVSQMMTRSSAHETMTTSEGSKQSYERLAWKAIGTGVQHDGDTHGLTPQRLFFSPPDLASFLFVVYLHMFFNEHIASRLFLLSPEHMLRELQRSGILHYNRRSFALFVHYVKTRVEADWWCTMDFFEDLLLADNSLVTGKHAYHELCCQFHLLGVFTTAWMSAPAFTHHIMHLSDHGPFRDWTPRSIRPVVTLVLVVPREAIARLEPEFKNVGTPVLQCDMENGEQQLWFGVTSATFGSFRVSGTGENRTGVVVEGDQATSSRDTPAARMQPPWRNGASMIITFEVPASSVMSLSQNPRATVGLTLRPTIGTMVKLADRLGFDLTVFRTKLMDTERVFVLAQRPVVGSNTSTSAASPDTMMEGVIAGHWHEDGSASSEQGTDGPEIARRSTDVHVQLDDDSPTLQSFTVRINVTEPSARAVLSNAQTFPAFGSPSGSSRSLDAYVAIGGYTYTVRFPLPVDVARVKLRIARRSSYIEVVAPPASFDVRPERDISDRFAFSSLSDHGSGGHTPMLGSIHRVNLDKCRLIKVPESPLASSLNWFNVHLSFMFSGLEKQRTSRRLELKERCRLRGQSIDTVRAFAPDALLEVKQTLRILLGYGPRATPTLPNSVFALHDASRGVPYLYIIVAGIRLDVGSHTVVADAFVAPGTPTVLMVLTSALRDTRGMPIGAINTDSDEAAVWFHLVPHLIERCRTWPHKTTCSYRAALKDAPRLKTGNKGSPRTWDMGQSPLCNCGNGIGTEVLPKQFKPVAPYLTRAAFSPLFPVPYLNEVDVPVCVPDTQTGWSREHATTPNASHNQNRDGNKAGAPEASHSSRCRSCNDEGNWACVGCKRARYCSKACQRADWKAHKKDCMGASASGGASTIA